MVLSLSPLNCSRPTMALRRLVGHYWASAGGANAVYPALPDGAVDLVIEILPSSFQSWLYGTTTVRTIFPLDSQARYIGIRFRPGCSRHFMRIAARELTDRHEPAQDVLRFPLAEFAERSAEGDWAVGLDDLLSRYLARQPPRTNAIDRAVDLIESRRDTIRIREVASYVGKSQRQFERDFLENVGISAKLFASIIRFRHAARLIRDGMPIAAVAADTGYADQSHLSHEFKRLAGVSPRRFPREAVDFLQDRV
ncbi:MAG TPA: hypothetical protein DCQ84_03160 [Candidatus Competibacteraceae bacterium]|nr:hypothetical protein [Candidatus Competibacteraceae bacterium]